MNKTWKLTKRGIIVVSILETLGLVITVWGSAWLMWALLNTIVGN